YSLSCWESTGVSVSPHRERYALAVTVELRRGPNPVHVRAGVQQSQREHSAHGAVKRSRLLTPNKKVNMPTNINETAGWTTPGSEYPLSAQRGEGKGEGWFDTTEAAFGQCLHGLPLSPLLRRGEREKGQRHRCPQPCRLSGGLTYDWAKRN